MREIQSSDSTRLNDSLLNQFLSKDSERSPRLASLAEAVTKRGEETDVFLTHTHTLQHEKTTGAGTHEDASAPPIIIIILFNLLWRRHVISQGCLMNRNTACVTAQSSVTPAQEPLEENIYPFRVTFTK